MTHAPRTPRRPAPAPSTGPRASALPRRRALFALGSLGLLAGGCGGGGDTIGTGSGGTGSSFTTGPISGFGSIIVNGIRYDDSTASVSDDLGNPVALTRLGLGMIVEVDGTTDDRLGTGVARTIRTVSEIVGRIESIDRAAARLVVLGTVVQVDATTLWEDARGLESLAVGDVVEVWGFGNASTGVLAARRIERKPTDTKGKLRGTVSTLDTTARTFRIGTQLVDYSGLASVPGLANGVRVRVVGPIPALGSAWRPERIELAGQRIEDGVSSVRIDGTVSELSGTRFVVAGIAVDASGARFEDGTAASLRPGGRVRVYGTGSGGGVRATIVEIRNSDGSGSGSSSSDGTAELRGTIVRFASVADFTLRDGAAREFVVDASGAQLRDGTTLADLRVGAFVEVDGNPGPVFVAREIKLESASGSGSSDGTIELRGTIVRFASVSDFTVRDLSGRDFVVDASGAVFRDGTTPADLRVGALVEVEGRPGTVLVATEIKRQT